MFISFSNDQLKSIGSDVKIGFLCGFALNFERTVIRICMRQCNKRNVWINAGNKGLEMDILCNVKSI